MRIITRRGLLLGGIVTLSLAGLGASGKAWADTMTIALQRTSFTSTKLKAPLRVLQLTDLHDADPGGLAKVVEHIAATEPHLIALTGDFVNSDTRDFGGVQRWFAGLVATGVPAFGVWGNHDHWNGRLDHIWAIATKAGITMLVNQSVPFDGPWGQADIVGTDDPYTGRHDWDASLSHVRTNSYRLVLTHAPEIASTLPYSGADLAICGHTHGGQIRAPFVGALIVPGQGFLPERSLGTYDISGIPLHISGGVGTTGPSVRFLSPSTVDLLTILPG